MGCLKLNPEFLKPTLKVVYRHPVLKEKEVQRFLSVDPLTKDYPYLTPYAFAENDVIRSIDLDGLEKLALSGSVPINQYARYRNGEYQGPTHYESSHVMTFKAQAERLRKNYGYDAQQISSGEDLLSALVSTTKTYGFVSRLAYFGHSGAGGFFLKNDEGFYYNKSVLPDNAGLGARTIEDLQTLIKSGDIKFSNDAICVIDGCRTAGTGEVQTGIAYQLAAATGASVIASTGSVYMKDESDPNGQFTTDGNFYLIQFKPKMVPNPDRFWYQLWKPSMVESKTEREVSITPLGNEINLDDIIK